MSPDFSWHALFFLFDPKQPFSRTSFQIQVIWCIEVGQNQNTPYSNHTPTIGFLSLPQPFRLEPFDRLPTPWPGPSGPSQCVSCWVWGASSSCPALGAKRRSKPAWPPRLGVKTWKKHYHNMATRQTKYSRGLEEFEELSRFEEGTAPFGRPFVLNKNI